MRRFATALALRTAPNALPLALCGCSLCTPRALIKLFVFARRVTHACYGNCRARTIRVCGALKRWIGTGHVKITRTTWLVNKLAPVSAARVTRKRPVRAVLRVAVCIFCALWRSRRIATFFVHCAGSLVVRAVVYIALSAG